MDPATAFFNMVTALANMIIEISKGQPVEMKKQMWDWFINDVTEFRNIFHKSADNK
jgi:hypothetical protein